MRLPSLSCHGFGLALAFGLFLLLQTIHIGLDGIAERCLEIC